MFLMDSIPSNKDNNQTDQLFRPDNFLGNIFVIFDTINQLLPERCWLNRCELEYVRFTRPFEEIFYIPMCCTDLYFRVEKSKGLVFFPNFSLAKYT